MKRAVLVLICLAGCLTGDASNDGDDGEGGPDDLGNEPAATDLHNLNIGFNDGYIEQFGFYNDYFSATQQRGPRLCHAYVWWNVMSTAKDSGDPTDHMTRAFLDNWFRAAKGNCDEALISFKARNNAQPPTADEYGTAFDKFAANDWQTETGFAGALSFTPWNEPNNPAGDGNGLGVQIPARLAADYFMEAERSCRKHGCKVAAGDFASNGNMWDSFRWQCSNDNVADGQLCKTHSAAYDASTPGPSYLDNYKNEIANHATKYGLPAGYRPDYFAYHGWHDANMYLKDGDHCTAYANCALRRILRSLGGSWGGVEIWDTEDGAAQNDPTTDENQACTAAFMLRLQAISSRVRRLYVTRLHGGAGGLINVDAMGNHVPRPALGIFANRDRNATNCR
ncbi:MAG: hypothetical protein QM831_03010 [Kofleriaceae bacterium]